MRFLLFLYILLFLISCKEKGFFEKEPNNSFSSSNAVELDKVIKGFIDSRDDRDFYRIDITIDTVLDIKLTGIKGINHSFKIWKGSENPVLIKWVDDNRKSSPEQIANCYTEKGTYYFTVLHGDRDRRKSNKETPYSLIISGREPVFEESEPNDNSKDANPISTGNELMGYFSPAYNRLNYSKKYPFREEDWFKINIELESGEPVLIDATLSKVTGVNSVLYLYDSNNNEVAVSDNRGPGLAEEIKGIGITKSGNYHIMITSKGYGFNNEEPYYLNVSFSKYDPSYEMEPNSDPDKANLINQDMITGKISLQGDIDYYLYRSNSDKLMYKIELLSPDNLDLKLTILDHENNKIIDINNSGPGEKEVFPNIVLSGNFYISVSARMNSYDPDSEYILLINQVDVSEDSEIEPNDNKSHANRVRDRKIIGYISKKGDKDYYLLEYNSRIKQNIKATGVKNGEINISITDPLGFIIKTVKIRGNKEILFTEMIDEKSYIIVESVKENYDEPYTITLIGDK